MVLSFKFSIITIAGLEISEFFISCSCFKICHLSRYNFTVKTKTNIPIWTARLRTFPRCCINFSVFSSIVVIVSFIRFNLEPTQHYITNELWAAVSSRYYWLSQTHTHTHNSTILFLYILKIVMKKIKDVSSQSKSYIMIQNLFLKRLHHRENDRERERERERFKKKGSINRTMLYFDS